MNLNPKKQFVIQPLPCCSSEIGHWLWALDDARRRTLISIEGLETNRLDIIDWVSPMNGNSIGMLLYHIAAVDASWLYEEVLVEDFPSDIQTSLPFDIRDSQGQLTTLKGVMLDEHLD